MKHFNNITTLIFDLGGVVINLDLPKCIQNFKQLGVENFENYLSNFGQKGFFLQFEKGQIGVDEFRTEIRKLALNNLTNKQIDDAWCSFLCDIPMQKINILLELKTKFRLIVLSNTNPLHIKVSTANEFSRYGLIIDNVFDSCYFSYEMGMVKPDAEIFLTLLKNEHVTANECLFLDDGEKNIERAQQLGIQTYLVKPYEDLNFLLKPETWG
ncbi:MAG: HAD family phosphatase [Paludibacter sp.]|nr:HAD family phosphatase [Paludibacter sp.]